MMMEERRRMSSRMDDLPLILGVTLVAFVLGATTPVIVHRLEPEPEPPPAQTLDLQQLRDAVGALERNVADLSKTVSGLTTEVDRLRTGVAAAEQPPPPPPAAAPRPPRRPPRGPGGGRPRARPRAARARRAPRGRRGRGRAARRGGPRGRLPRPLRAAGRPAPPPLVRDRGRFRPAARGRSLRGGS